MVLVRAQRVGQPLDQDSCTLAVGGAESNVAIGLSRLGHQVRWIGALGSDAFGDMVESVLLRENLEVVAHRSPERPTGLMVKSPSVGSERFVSYYRAGSAATELDASSVSDDILSDARMIHLTGITPALSEAAQTMTVDVAQRAKSRGVTVSFDVNYRSALWPRERAAPVLRQIAGHADLIFGELGELELLVDDPPANERDLLDSVAALGARHVVLKRGERGAVALVGGELYEESAIPVDVVDTVGAGDAFVAGYLSGVLDSLEVGDALRRGVICGGLACRNPGDWEGAPTREELDAVRMDMVL